MDGDYGYGGNVAHAGAEDARFEDYVANVGAAQAANQNTVQKLVARKNIQVNAITQLQQQHVQMVEAMNQAPAALPIQHQQQWYQPLNPQRANGNKQGGNRGNGRGGGGGRGNGRSDWTGQLDTNNQEQAGQATINSVRQ